MGWASTVRKILVILIVLLVFQAAAVTGVEGEESKIWYYPPTPQGDIGVKKPTILWTIVGIHSQDIGKITMSIDNAEVAADFKDELNSVYYMPQDGLTEGEHSVSIIVILKDGVKISSPPFSFNVVEGAYDEIPDTPLYHEVRDRINYYRRLVGITPAEINASLNLAAYNHGLYLTGNPAAGHYENNKGDQYFSGKFPWDRTKYFGYFSPMIGENIHFVRNHTGAVDDWIDSLYHRLPILNPIFTHLGYGYAVKGDRFFNVLEMGAPSYLDLEQHIIVYPAEDQPGVPVTWSGLEDPDPFRLYPEAEGPGGYPITLTVSGDKVERVEMLDASMFDSEGTSIDVYTFDARNDPMLADNNTIAIIPESELDTYTGYQVEMRGIIRYIDGEEEKFSKAWRFTTGGGGLETYDYNAELKVYVDGHVGEFDPKPFITEGRTLIPVRSFCEQLGALVKWHPETYTVEIIREDTVISFDIGSTETSVNSKLVELDVPAKIYNDRTFVPLRFVSEVLGFEVKWDAITRSVLIYSR